MTSSPIGDLRRRGLVAQVSDEPGLNAHLDSASRTLYCGFDASADSLHHAHLLQIVSLRRFQLAGHRPIALVGGATGLIGDPSFKSDERVLLDRVEVARNADAVGRQIERFIDFEQSPAAGQGALLVNNLDWTEKLDVITFLRDVGKHFSVNEMMRKESVRARLEREGSGISFTEFSYQILQANDFVELARRHDCSLQIGGNDQWGNITAGMNLVRRTLGREAYALTSPLITKADGTKFGKTETGTIWLAPERTSPFAFFQFWINTADDDVVGFLGYFTFLSMEEIETLAEATKAHPETREAQRRLATEMTSFVHGEGGLRGAERITEALFSGSTRDLTESDLEQLAQDGMEHTTVSGDSHPCVNVLAETPLANSRGAARRLIASGGVSVNGDPVMDGELSLDRKSALFGRYHLLRRGKKSWHLIAWE